MILGIPDFYRTTNNNIPPSIHSRWINKKNEIIRIEYVNKDKDKINIIYKKIYTNNIKICNRIQKFYSEFEEYY
tara:strand:- start:888 stop:1109 length:222 start_codon:yes stop_codon:yes gene_type:complete